MGRPLDAQFACRPAWKIVPAQVADSAVTAVETCAWPEDGLGN